MPNSNRRRGDYFERRTRAALEAQGWLVIRSAGSLGVADLVALKAGHTPMLVSCKLRGKVPLREFSALCDAATRSGADGVIAQYARTVDNRIRDGWVALELITDATRKHLYILHMPPRERKPNNRADKAP